MATYRKQENFNGEKLRKVLGLKGLTTEWLAKELGVTPQTIDRLIRNSQKPSIPVFKLICAVLECDESDLTGKEKQDNNSNIDESIMFTIGQSLGTFSKRVEELGYDVQQSVKRIEELTNDLARLSAVIMDIQRTTKQTDANIQTMTDVLGSHGKRLNEITSSCGSICSKLAKFEKGAK